MFAGNIGCFEFTAQILYNSLWFGFFFVLFVAVDIAGIEFNGFHLWYRTLPLELCLPRTPHARIWRTRHAMCLEKCRRVRQLQELLKLFVCWAACAPSHFYSFSRLLWIFWFCVLLLLYYFSRAFVFLSSALLCWSKIVKGSKWNCAEAFQWY